MTILELGKKLKLKEKVIAAQNRSLKKKDNQLKLLRDKLKSTKINKGNIMKSIKEIFNKDEDKQKVSFFEMQLKNGWQAQKRSPIHIRSKDFLPGALQTKPKMLSQHSSKALQIAK